MRPRDVGEAAQALEATLLRQLLSASGAFRGGALAGSQMRADMFVEVLADAVARGGGLGLSRMIEASLPRQPDAPASRPPSPAAITSGFGVRQDPIEGDRRFHTGVDLRAREGAPIRAVEAGVVERAGPRGGYGNAVEIRHPGGLATLYAHAPALAVEPGQRVEAGQIVGWVGQSGRATGPHLHLETRIDGRPVDPVQALKAYGARVESAIGSNPQTVARTR